MDGAGPVPHDPQHEAALGVEEPLGAEAAYGAEATHAPQDEERRPLVAAERGQRRAADPLAPVRVGVVPRQRRGEDRGTLAHVHEHPEGAASAGS